MFKTNQGTSATNEIEKLPAEKLFIQFEKEMLAKNSPGIFARLHNSPSADEIRRRGETVLFEMAKWSSDKTLNAEWATLFGWMIKGSYTGTPNPGVDLAVWKEWVIKNIPDPSKAQVAHN